MLVDFVNSVPHPLTAVLVRLARPIAAAAVAAETLSWRRSWHHALLLVFAWWALCLFAPLALRYALPAIAVVAAAVNAPRSPPSPLTTEHTLQTTIAHLSTVQSLLPAVPSVPGLSVPTALRFLALAYPPYLALTYFVPLRILCALAGTLFLTHRAPPAVVLRRTLARSAFLRSLSTSLASTLTAQPLPPAPKPPVQAHSPALRFLFTVYENHRWWMGLDWTAALLPGERPSWCTSNHAPVSPPAAFALPPPTTVFLPAPNPKQPGGRLKRTATWSWEDSEWRVLIRNDGGSLARVPRPLPDDAPTTSTSSPASRILKGPIAPAPAPAADDTSGADDDSSADELSTDADGWVYGDNKWEGLGPKGGMGKYTRYRRWTRVAVVSEAVEEVGPGELGILREDDDGHVTSSDPTVKGTRVDSYSITVNGVTTPPAVEEESPLRQRLRRALSKPATPIGH